jgi:TolB-like protein
MSKFRLLIFCVLLLNFTLFTYGKGTQEGSLDKAIDTQGQFLLDKMPLNSILAVVGISSGSEDLSKYITEGLTSYIMNNNTKNIMIVERAAMPILQQEIDFQYSGAVDDDLMISIGKMVGANTVITGTIYSIGSNLRFNIRAIEIETTFVVVSHGMDFYADKKLKSLLKGGTIEKTLSRDNIPIRQSDGSISKANRELRESQIQTINNTASFFSKDFLDRERRLLIGYNYFPDFPISIEGGYLRNGLGFYGGFGAEPKTALASFSTNYKESYYKFSYIGESLGVFNFYFGVTYPLYFNWLWISGGSEMCVIAIATEYTNYQLTDFGIDDHYLSEPKLVFNPSIGLYFSIKRFYMTTKYRYLFYGNNSHSFMFGLGICL